MMKQLRRITNRELSHQTLIDVFSRLPLRDIFSCMCVCKTWKCLIISDPNFAQLYLKRAPSSLILRSRKHGRRRCPRSLYLLDLESSDRECSSRTKPDDAMLTRFVPDFGLPNGDFEVVNTCDGMICVRHFQAKIRISIMNPVTGGYVTLPLARMKLKFNSSSSDFYWFGFSHKTDVYKVVRFIVVRSWMYEIEIYTLGTSGTWRSVKASGLHSVDLRKKCHVFIEGCLHWIDHDPKSSGFITSFDFGYERFQSVPAPPYLGPNDKDRTENMMLGALGKCLCLFDYPLGDQFHIWVMKRYGIQGSWIRDFVIKNPSTDIVWYWDLYRPVALLRNGEVLMSHKSKAMICYNPKSQCFRFLKFYGIRNFEATPYVPSFISLRDIVKGENLKASNIHSCRHLF